MLKNSSMTRALRWTAATTVVATGIAVGAPVLTAGASSPARNSATTVSRSVATSNQMTSRVFGTFGKAGTVRGHFVPVRSFVRNGKTFVQGDMTSTLRRGNGALVGRSVRHDVTLPVKASGASRAAVTADARATCSILHLVLGPLDLNLLGLMVHLNRVVLDITAQSGPGNLLGNLLCGVAGLLDGVSPTLADLLNLSNLLNRLIGMLT